MSSPSLALHKGDRPIRGEARRLLIASAALDVMSRVGADALTHRLVAAEAGLPIAATTYWFKGKEDIIEAAFKHAAQQGIAQLEASRAKAAGWTRETIASELAIMIEDSTTARRDLVVRDWTLWIEAVRRPALRPIAEQWSDALVAVMRQALEAAGSPASQDIARLLAAAVDGLAVDRLARETPLVTNELVELLEHLIRALVD